MHPSLTCKFCEIRVILADQLLASSFKMKLVYWYYSRTILYADIPSIIQLHTRIGWLRFIKIFIRCSSGLNHAIIIHLIWIVIAYPTLFFILVLYGTCLIYEISSSLVINRVSGIILSLWVYFVHFIVHPAASECDRSCYSDSKMLYLSSICELFFVVVARPLLRVISGSVFMVFCVSICVGVIFCG